MAISEEQLSPMGELECAGNVCMLKSNSKA